jgi:hypothetical protein
VLKPVVGDRRRIDEKVLQFGPVRELLQPGVGDAGARERQVAEPGERLELLQVGVGDAIDPHPVDRLAGEFVVADVAAAGGPLDELDDLGFLLLVLCGRRGRNRAQRGDGGEECGAHRSGLA